MLSCIRGRKCKNILRIAQWLISQRGVRRLKWIKRLFSKNAHPALCVKQEGELQSNETNRICGKCVQITYEQGIERDDYSPYILFHK